MDRDTLVMGLAAVFAGIAMLLIVLGFVYQLFLLVAAVPFIVATYLMWDHASGRFQARIRQEQTRRRARSGPNAASRGPNDFEGFGPGRRSATNTDSRRNGRRSRRTTPDQSPDRPSAREAYRTLGLDPSATTEEVKDAYRRMVKEVHPDTESGSKEEFKRVNRAYERLSD
ncbi:J domain-containing protein [Halogeometricum borinquense]|uniref:J domain-containing protein n=1 Tax=Halogeometricum borinquense TaxID=60847 RepID=A0A6C0UIP2_9EURY|nr:J domain-containing protein [Halogeometricum borinquense]QIB75080.1 J domain-containing protein [Halogeometricum borinquense]QIQ75939.1 J domain-containing protein [Halogeometricum borinquense]